MKQRPLLAQGPNRACVYHMALGDATQPLWRIAAS
jgi:hypothetical protein